MSGPVSRVALLTVLISVSAGLQAGPARGDGTIVGWGDDFYRQCDAPRPNSDYVAIAAAAPGDYSMGLKFSGIAGDWGSCCGGPCVPAPSDEFVAIAGGQCHMLGLRSDGSVYAWGNDSFHQCDVPSPNKDFVAIAGGGAFSIGLKKDGSLVAWGSNGYGECSIPSPNSDFEAVSAGTAHALGLKADGSIVAWGDNRAGQCDVPSPNSDFAAVAAGCAFSLGLRTDGTIVAWGECWRGQCDIPEPNSDFTAIAAGCAHGLGLKADRSVVAWGLDSYHQCEVPSPDSGFVAIAGGAAHSLALRSSQIGACCRPDGGCTLTIAAWCFAPSIWHGQGSVCVPVPCGSSAVEPEPAVASISLTAFPNPSTGPVQIQNRASGSLGPDLEVFDAAGRLVRRLAPERTTAGGTGAVTWDGRDAGGRLLAGGIYFVRVKTEAGIRTIPVVRSK